MHSVQFIDFVLIYSSILGNFARNILLPTSTTGFFVFTSEMALRASLTGLNHSIITCDLSFLSFVARLRVVVGYMSLEQITTTSLEGPF